MDSPSPPKKKKEKEDLNLLQYNNNSQHPNTHVNVSKQFLKHNLNSQKKIKMQTKKQKISRASQLLANA